MASVHKTFANGTSLTATDINGALNPDTADHIPYAQACGGVSVNYPANDTTLQAVTVNLPAGRFSVAPNVVCSVSNGSAESRLVGAWPSSATTTSFVLCYAARSNLAAALNGVQVVWQAMQMTPSQASG